MVAGRPSEAACGLCLVPWHVTEGDELLVVDGAGGTEGLK